MNTKLPGIVLSCLVTVAATSTLGADAPRPKVTYQDNILPIFRNSCLNCHNPDKKKGGLDISSYSAAMAGSDGSFTSSSRVRSFASTHPRPLVQTL